MNETALLSRESVRRLDPSSPSWGGVTVRPTMPTHATGSPLGRREIEVLRLVADGYDTAEIAKRMSYSERTIKNVLHGLMSRLQLRNRPHAVAFALRQGLL